MRKFIYGVFQAALYAGIAGGTGLTGWIADRVGLATTLFNSIWIALVIGGALGTLMTLAWPIYAKPAEAFFERIARFVSAKNKRLGTHDLIPYRDIHDLANRRGWNLAQRDSPADNRAYDLECKMRQAASNGELEVWGRRLESSLGTNPLLPIPKEHFHAYEFQHGLLNGLNISNEKTRTDKLGACEADLVGNVFCDLHVSRSDIRQLLAKVKPTSGIVGAS